MLLPRTTCGFDEDEFSVHLDQDRSWALPVAAAAATQQDQYQSDIKDLTQDESIWIEGLRDPPPLEYTIDLMLSKVDVALAMEDDDRLVSIRYRLVPCWMRENEFWRIYFYRITLLRKLYLK